MDSTDLVGQNPNSAQMPGKHPSSLRHLARHRTIITMNRLISSSDKVGR